MTLIKIELTKTVKKTDVAATTIVVRYVKTIHRQLFGEINHLPSKNWNQKTKMKMKTKMKITKTIM